MTKGQCFAGAVAIAATVAFAAPAFAQGLVPPGGNPGSTSPAVAPSNPGGGALTGPGNNRNGGATRRNDGNRVTNGGNWRGNRDGRHRGPRGYGYGYGTGFGLGFAYGTAPYYYGPGYYVDEPEYYVDEGPAVSGDEVAYCRSRFKSYDPASGTYLGNDGDRHPCP